jgi:hypothetical protein
MARKAKTIEGDAKHAGSVEHSLGSRKKATAYGPKIKHSKNLGSAKGGHGFSKDAKKSAKAW